LGLRIRGNAREGEREKQKSRKNESQKNEKGETREIRAGKML
jgi:hypothetical protein